MSTQPYSGHLLRDLTELVAKVSAAAVSPNPAAESASSAFSEVAGNLDRRQERGMSAAERKYRIGYATYFLQEFAEKYDCDPDDMCDLQELEVGDELICGFGGEEGVKVTRVA